MNEEQGPNVPQAPDAPDAADEPKSPETTESPETQETAEAPPSPIPGWPGPEAERPARHARTRRLPRLRMPAWRTPGAAAIVAIVLISAILGGVVTGTILVNAPSLVAALPHWRGTTPAGGPLGLTSTGTGAAVVNTPYPSLLEGNAGTVVGVAQKVGPSVVKVTSYGTARSWYGRGAAEVALGSGSGFIIDARGYVVTNQHVIDRATRVEVTLADQESVSADIVGQDSVMDIAVLKVNKSGLSPVTLGDSDKLQVGELAIVIGNPLGLDHTVTVGVISALNRSIEDLGELNYKVIQTDASINLGNSGGPLVNGAGQVVGITSAKVQATGVEGLGFAIPINTAKSIINELLQKGKIVRPWLGVSVAEPQGALQYGVQLDHGLLIVQVISGGPAAKAGVRDKDILLSVDGQNVDTFTKLQAVLAQHRAGDSVKVVVLRGNTQLTIQVTLETAQTQ